MKKYNDYPIILVHGFLCWGSEDRINDFPPLFGMWNGSGRQAILEEGVKCFTPSVGPFSSMWDRACELYAQIKGGRVDYGKAHSEKVGCERYGKTYPGFVPNWGELDEAGKRQKISLIGHSFGGPTVVTLIHLLAEGSKEERDRTPADELSPLFAGGKAEWIHACTTLAGVMNGVTLTEAGPVVKAMEAAVYAIGNLVSGTPIARLYGFGLDRFGISSREKHLRFSWKKIKHVMDLKEGNIFYELSPEGCTSALRPYKTYDNIYYFSYAGCRTDSYLGGRLELPGKDMWLPLRPFSLFECLYSDKTHGKDWKPNDALVNVPSARYPEGQPHQDFVSLDACRPGIWNVMPLERKDHTSYMGVLEDKETYAAFMKSLAAQVTDLKPVE